MFGGGFQVQTYLAQFIKRRTSKVCFCIPFNRWVLVSFFNICLQMHARTHMYTHARAHTQNTIIVKYVAS